MIVIHVIIAAILVIFLVLGAKRGLIRQILDIIAIIVAFILAFYCANALARWITQRSSIEYGMARNVAALVIFAGVIFFLRWIGFLLHKRLEMSIFGFFDHVAGAFIGVVKGLMVLSLLLVLLLMLPLPKAVKNPILEDSVTASIYPILPVMYDFVITRVPGAERFEKIVPMGDSKTLERTKDKLREGINKNSKVLRGKAGDLTGTAGDLDDKAGDLKDTAEDLKDKATD